MFVLILGKLTYTILNHIMANTVSFGVIGHTGTQSKPDICAPTSTIVHSTVVGRRSFGALKTTSDREVYHLVTRRRSSAA